MQGVGCVVLCCLLRPGQNTSKHHCRSGFKMKPKANPDHDAVSNNVPNTRDCTIKGKWVL